MVTRKWKSRCKTKQKTKFKTRKSKKKEWKTKECKKKKLKISSSRFSGLKLGWKTAKKVIEQNEFNATPAGSPARPLHV